MIVKEISDINIDFFGFVVNEKYYCKFCGCDYEVF